MQSIELVILVGIQGSGKTTYYRGCMGQEYLHVSLDNWKGRGNVRHKEYEAIGERLREIAKGTCQKRGVVIDNTNTTAATRKRYFDYALEFWRETGRKVDVTAYSFDADLESCLQRNEQRPKDAPPGEPYFVPPPAIAAFHKRLEPPTYEEGFRDIFRVQITEDGDFEVTRV